MLKKQRPLILLLLWMTVLAHAAILGRMAHRTSNYGGAQASITTELARNTIQAGLYSFGQHDSYLFGTAFHDGSGSSNFRLPDAAAGGVIEEYISDNRVLLDNSLTLGGFHFNDPRELYGELRNRFRY